MKKLHGHIFWFLLIFCGSCTYLSGAGEPLPPVDLSQPGWRVWTGQAVWTTGDKGPTLAGYLLVAEQGKGELVVNFTKIVVPLFTARVSAGRWWLDFIERDRSYSGKGRPPARFVWFRAADILRGENNIPGWEIRRDAADEVSIMNPSTGEQLFIVVESQ